MQNNQQSQNFVGLYLTTYLLLYVVLLFLLCLLMKKQRPGVWCVYNTTMHFLHRHRVSTGLWVRERSLFSSLARPQASTSHLVLNGSAALLCVSPRKYSSVYKNWKKKSELCLTPALGRRINSLIRNKLRIGSRDSIIRSATDLLWPWGSHWTLQFPLV